MNAGEDCDGVHYFVHPGSLEYSLRKTVRIPTETLGGATVYIKPKNPCIGTYSISVHGVPKWANHQTLLFLILIAIFFDSKHFGNSF